MNNDVRRLVYAMPRENGGGNALIEAYFATELRAVPAVLDEASRGPEAEAELWAFLQEHVMHSVHILDPHGTMAAWSWTWPKEIQANLSLEVARNWKTLFSYLKIMNYFPVHTLRNLVASKYPRAFTAPDECVQTGCRALRPYAHIPACDAHMCGLCRGMAAQDGWHDMYRVVRTSVGVHMYTRDPDLARRLDAELQRRCYNQVERFCPGVLRTCAAENEMSGYYRHPECVRDAMPTPLDEAVLVPELCHHCWDHNKCRFNPTHLLDPTDPQRCKAHVCARPDCNTRHVCRLCHEVRFEIASIKDKNESQLLCDACLFKGVACSACDRVAVNAHSGFFALRWVMGAADALSHDRRHRYCVWCLPKIQQPFGKGRGGASIEKRRALLLQWRFLRRRQLWWFIDFVDRHPEDWLKRLQGERMTARELHIVAQYVPGGWATMQRDPCAWDCLFVLLLRFAWLPKDAFLLVWRYL